MSKTRHAEDLKRPGDSGRKPPAIPLAKREAFLEDVRQAEAGAIDRTELARRWAKWISVEQPRTLYDWRRWAVKVLAARGAQQAEPTKAAS